MTNIFKIYQDLFYGTNLVYLVNLVYFERMHTFLLVGGALIF